MLSPRIRIGVESFRELRENNYCYIDKTKIFEELLCKNNAKVYLITRPRRFGKKLTMNMMQEFFDISKDSSDIFNGLHISKNVEVCKKWMNKYPVISISFKDVDGIDYSEAYDWCLCRIADVFEQNRYL
ncbi:MAG: AAA family ATPase, partial [Desulfovibrio sp.]|nr:AAA family ATPase [Desulfovibrio sp.]